LRGVRYEPASRLVSLATLLSPILFYFRLPDSVARRWLVGRNAPPALISSLRAAISSVKPEVLSARLRAVLVCDVRAELSEIELPVLYLQAEQDRLVAKSSLEEVRRIKTEILVASISGPHLLLQREPQCTADCIAKFVQRLT
jgi:pimeloyl-ACP methyl ester carboxylesterase